DKMRQQEFTVSATHGDMAQQEREDNFSEFHTGSSRVLITTDYVSRGIDVQQVSHIINYDLPKNLKLYVRRIGLCGRFGRKGEAINFVTTADLSTLTELERFYDIKIEEIHVHVPTSERKLDS